jgi:predicted nucleic acid-binding protein
MKVFMDVNIMMYSAGSRHPYKEPSTLILQQVATAHLDAVIDSEILQEILYRYWHLKILDQGITLVNHAVQVIPTILPVAKPDLLLCTALLAQHHNIEPRDAIHAAVMLNHGITQIYSYDCHFDSIPGIRRLEPSFGTTIL